MANRLSAIEIVPFRHSRAQGHQKLNFSVLCSCGPQQTVTINNKGNQSTVSTAYSEGGCLRKLEKTTEILQSLARLDHQHGKNPD